MAYARRRVHGVFGDSRVSDSLYKAIQQHNTAKIPFTIEQYKGAKLGEVINKADIYLDSFPFDVVYIIAGVNDITTKDKNTNSIDFLWRSEDELAGHLIDTMKAGHAQLKKDHPGAGITFCPLIGLDLQKAAPHCTLEQQAMVDNSVWRFNIELCKLRDSHKFFFPFLAAPVHRIENGQHKSYYHHLGNDGLHLSSKMNQVWAKQLVKAFDRN